MFIVTNPLTYGFPGGSVEKNFPVKARDMGSIPCLARSLGEGNGNPLSILVQKIPWTEVSGGLQTTGSQTVTHTADMLVD